MSGFNFRDLRNVIVINIFILLTGLLVIELVFGSWFHSSNHLFQLTIIKNKKLVYNIEELYQSENRVVNYSRDKFGLRGRYNNVDNINILSVGGSTTDQRYITDGSTWQDILQNCFHSVGEAIIVANAGVDGQSTYGHIKNFDMWFNLIPNLKPQYFLFSIGVNDFHVNNDSSLDDLVLINNSSSKIHKIKSRIKNNSVLYYLYQLIKNILSAYDAGLGHKPGHSPQNFNEINWIKGSLIKNHENHFKDRLSAFEKRLEILCQKVKEYGAIPIFVTLSERRLYKFIGDEIYGDSSWTIEYDGLRINSVDYYHIISLYKKITEKISKMNNAIFIDLDSELKFNLKNDFYDSNHHTPSGAKKVGEYLFNKLKNILM